MSSTLVQVPSFIIVVSAGDAGDISFEADFHSVQNVERSIFRERFLLKRVKSTTANEIHSA